MNKISIPVMLLALLVAACSRVAEPGIAYTPTEEPKVTKAPTMPPAATPFPAVQTSTPSGADQQALKVEWRIPYQSSMTLFSACEFMFETLYPLQQGEKEIAQAREELSIESDLAAMGVKQYFQWVVPHETGFPVFMRLQSDIDALTGIFDQLMQADDAKLAATAQAVIDSLGETCASLNETFGAAAMAAMQAGITEQSLRELESEIDEVINDYRDRILEGN